MNITGHILTEFDLSLQKLKDDTTSIGTLTIRNIENAFNGLIDKNPTLCKCVIADDEEVDQFEIQIDNICLNIMAKYRPFASDLRMVVASMKITHDLERVSDHAVSIAKRARKILKRGEIEETTYLEPVFQHAHQMLQTALLAYTDKNMETAKQVLAMEPAFIKIHKSTTKKFTKMLQEPTDLYKSYLDLVFIIRWIVRIGDLATNIAEDVIFMETAQDIRHGGEIPES